LSKRSGSEGNGLQVGALSGFDSAVMAIAGCGPGYMIAAAVPVLIATVGVAGPAVLLYCVLPVIGIALAFRQLGRIDVSAGAGYTWVARGLHPFLGFMCGWALIVSTIAFWVFTTWPAGEATIVLLGGETPVDPAAAMAVGAGWFLLVAVVVTLGVRLSARAQTVITVLQLTLLLTFAVLALSKDGGAADFSFSWFGFGHFDSSHTLVAGALVAVFTYSGWDVTSNLSEETRRGRRSGFGGLIGLLVAFTLYLVFTIAANILIGADAVTADPADFLSVLGEAVLPGWGGRMLVLAVVLSSIATLETTLIQATRTLFAMGRDRTLPAVLGRTHPTWKTPWWATMAVSGVAFLLIGGFLVADSPEQFLTDAFNGVGLQVALNYGLVGLAAVVVHRKVLLRSPANLLLMGLWPLGGALFMAWVFVASLPGLSAGSLVMGLGTLALGLVPMFVSWSRGNAYYRPQPLDPDRAEAVDESSGASGAAGRRDEILSDF